MDTTQLTIENGKPDTSARAARALSLLMHPLLIPVYLTAILLFGDTVMFVLPLRVKVFFMLVVALNTCVIPAMALGLLRGLGYIKGYNSGARRDRIIPLAIALLCYGLCAYTIDNIFSAFLLRKVLIAASVCIAAGLAVSYFRSISLHMLAFGGMVAVLLILTVSWLGYLIPYLVAFLLIAGLACSARLYLAREEPSDAFWGFIVGFGVAAVAFFI